ncbi:MAG: co-chaperone DjlA [Gammaproteobacteria bacterium]|nr:co-chaperone DjlA [Gammaproteobacteria bacterium]
MSWWGKVVGGAFGMMLGGPLGALLGAALGHKFDKGLSYFSELGRGSAKAGKADKVEIERIQSAFFTATFSVMGCVAKTDGHVTNDEIAVAQQVMDQMQLTSEQRQMARNLFNQGKQPNFPLEAVVTQFRNECQRRVNLRRMFLEVQLLAAYADGEMKIAERQLLIRIAELLGLSLREFQAIERIFEATYQFRQSSSQSGYGGQQGRQRRADVHSEAGIAAAYRLLDVSATASDDEVKRAYRRMMSRNHPDKLVSKGLPEEMMRLATEKTQEIKSAYEQIKRVRGIA